MNAYSDSLRHSSSHPFHSSFHLQHTHTPNTTFTCAYSFNNTDVCMCVCVCVCVPSHTHYTHIRTRVFFISLFPSIFQCKSREREREREELFKQKILPAYPHISRKEPVQARSDVKYLRANLQK